MNITMSLEESEAWRPGLIGNSKDILPWYRAYAEQAADGVTVCEFGVATGRSLIFLASEFVRLGKSARIFGFDPWSIKFKPNWYAQALHSFIDHATAAEVELLHLMREEPGEYFDDVHQVDADMIFIDDLHTEKITGTNVSMAVLQRPRIIAGHDFCRDWPDVEKVVTAQLGEVNHYETVWWKEMK